MKTTINWSVIGQWLGLALAVVCVFLICVAIFGCSAAKLQDLSPVARIHMQKHDDGLATFVVIGIFSGFAAVAMLPKK